MADMGYGRVVVIGSINVDLVVDAERLPAPGETVLGGAFAQHHGGKGANQAVAAARAGADVTLVGAIGDDPFGAAAREALAREGVDVTHVAVRGAPTGVALITVDRAGENQIVVAPGANALLRPEDVDAAILDAADPVDLVLTGFEVPMSVVVAVARDAAERGIPAVVNVAPAAPLPSELLESGSIFVLNELELMTATDTSAPEPALDALISRGASSVVVTLGAAGAMLAYGSTRTAIAAFPTRSVVDSTGAGDTFVGVLAARLAAGDQLPDATIAGAAAGALSVSHAGAREGMPTAAALAAFLEQHGR